MSQQPPYGAYPNPYAQFPPPRNNTTRNVLLIVGGVVLLFCLGVIGFFVWALNGIEDAFEGDDFPGSDDDPITVTEGEAFEIRGFEYAAGWSVTSTGDELSVDDLRATNERADGDSESIALRLRLYEGNEQVAVVRCSTVLDLAPDRAATLNCTSLVSGTTPVTFDEIEVYDDSYTE